MPSCERYVSTPSRFWLCSEQDLVSHTSQGQESNIKRIGVLVGSGFPRLAFGHTRSLAYTNIMKLLAHTHTHTYRNTLLLEGTGFGVSDSNVKANTHTRFLLLKDTHTHPHTHTHTHTCNDWHWGSNTTHKPQAGPLGIFSLLDNREFS